jgi:AraC-like DNA-binding protein
MIEGGETPSVVAFKLGFADQSHLTRHFKRGSFTTPGRFASLTRKT